MVQLAPTVRLNTGRQIPVIGLGTWKGVALAERVGADGSQRTTGEVEQAVRDAIDAGYRHFDCALIYENEEEIGDAIRAKIAEGVIKREEIFVTSKLWNTFHRPDMVEPTCRLSLKKLGLDYLDLYLVHFPTAWKEGDEYFPKDKDGKIIFSNVDLVDTWRAMEDLVAKGLVKNIGVSNYNTVQLKRCVENAKIPPAVNQIEVTPYLQQKKLLKLCKDLNVVACAYSPFGTPSRPWADLEKERDVLKDPLLIETGKKYNKNVGQLILRFLIQLGFVVLPKSANANRIKTNIDIFDFELTPQEMADLEKLDCNQRIHPFGITTEHPEYPFNIE